MLHKLNDPPVAMVRGTRNIIFSFIYCPKLGLQKKCLNVLHKIFLVLK